VDSKAEYTAQSSTRSQNLKQSSATLIHQNACFISQKDNRLLKKWRCLMNC